jgi:glycosyltransferase involved in cell wall biosynthesis
VLLAADADVYVAAGAGMPAGWAYDAARLRKAGFVFLAAHDDDTIPALPFLRTRRERWWYRRALAGADARIAQSTAQHAFLRAGFNLDSEVVASPAELPSRLADPGENETVVWLSTYRHHKRPTWFVELARRLPQLHFVMNGMPAEGDDDSTLPAIRRAAADLPNLEVGGFVERTRVTEYLGRAGLFVQTSPAEGFPMSLLEVWSLGIPSVTTVDPDGTIERHGVGEVVSTVEELAESVSRLMSAPDLRREMGLRARRYVEEQHGPDRTYEPLAAVLDRVIERRRGRGRLAGSHGAGEGDSGASERGCDRGR